MRGKIGLQRSLSRQNDKTCSAAGVPQAPSKYLFPSPFSGALIVGKAVALMADREPGTGDWGIPQNASVQRQGSITDLLTCLQASHGTGLRTDCRNKQF